MISLSVIIKYPWDLIYNRPNFANCYNFCIFFVQRNRPSTSIRLCSIYRFSFGESCVSGTNRSETAIVQLTIETPSSGNMCCWGVSGAWCNITCSIYQSYFSQLMSHRKYTWHPRRHTLYNFIVTSSSLLKSHQCHMAILNQRLHLPAY